MIKLAVCDDDLIELQLIDEYLRQYMEAKPKLQISVKLFEDPVALVDDIERTGGYDIYILDVVMPRMNGIELGASIRSNDAACPIIYLTGSEHHALDAFRVHATGYLVKPVRPEKIAEEMELALASVKRGLNRSFRVKTSTGIVSVPLSSILYVELCDHIFHVIISGSRRVTSVTQRQALRTIMEPLLANEFFIRPHKSYVVNMTYVVRLGSGFFHMRDGADIPIAQANYSEIKRRYLAVMDNG